MKVEGVPYRTIWVEADGRSVGIIDQTKLPHLFETIRRGRRGTTMQGFLAPSTVRPALADSEIESIVTFLRSREQRP